MSSGLSLLSQMAAFLSILRLNYISLSEYTTVFVHLSTDGHLDHLQIWAIVINATMNVGVQKK